MPATQSAAGDAASGGSTGSAGSAGTQKRTNRLWSKEESAALSAAVGQVGEDWSAVAALMPGRTGKQCRERYIHHLRPDLRKAPWTPQVRAVC